MKDKIKTNCLLGMSCFHKQSWRAYENKLKTTCEHGMLSNISYGGLRW